MIPCIISNISFEVDLPDDDEVQVCICHRHGRYYNTSSTTSSSSILSLTENQGILNRF